MNKTSPPPSPQKPTGAKAQADAILTPHLPPALAVFEFLKTSTRGQIVCDVEDVERSLTERAEALGLSRVEAMLYGQAASLNSVAGILTFEAAKMVRPSVEFRKAMRLALSVQARSAATLETLAGVLNARRTPSQS